MAQQPGYWNRVAQQWRAHRESLWRAHMDAVYGRWLAQWVPVDAAVRVLKTDLFDEATGAGLLPSLVVHARLAVGMDVAGEVVRAARDRHSDVLGVVTDVRALAFLPGAFDVIVSDSTLDHFRTLDEVATSLGELGRTLHLGGVLLLTMDNLANPLVALRAALPLGWLRRIGLVPYYVGASCGPARLRRMVENAGLEVREVDALLHGPRVLAVIFARILAGRESTWAARLYRRWLWGCEALGRWPSRFLTGHYVALRAVKPQAPDRAG